jgi:hypothetical protein
MTIDLLPLLPALFPIPLWILAILVGLWNNHRGNSFWVGFLLSLFFTPIGGAFLIATTTTRNKKAVEERRNPQEDAMRIDVKDYARNHFGQGERLLGVPELELQ